MPAGPESQEAWPGAERRTITWREPASGAPEGERAPKVRAAAPEHRQAATFVGVRGPNEICAFGAPLPRLLPGIYVVVVGKARTRTRRETDSLYVIARSQRVRPEVAGPDDKLRDEAIQELAA